MTNASNKKRLRLKVCGMCNADNISDLLTLHPNFIGFIFHEKSPRFCAHPPHVKIPGNIIKTGVFVDKSIEYIQNKKEIFGLQLIQLHGNEDPGFCHEVSKTVAPVMKAFRIDAHFNFQHTETYHNSCQFFLFDASGPLAGGNGITFDWRLLKNYHGNVPFLLSGGIDINMAKTIKQIDHTSLFGIDINSRFEISPGIKNIKKIKRFQHELSS